MADLYLDEAVPLPALSLFRRRGHRAYHARALCRGAAADVQLLLAARMGCVLVTSNQVDLVPLHNAWHHWPREWGLRPPPAHAGILLTPAAWRPDRLVATVQEFFAARLPAANRLYRWTPGRGWVELLPTIRPPQG